MNLKQLLEKIFVQYDRTQNIKNNEIATLLRKGLRDVDGLEDILTKEYQSSGSPGQGTWATIPWIGLFDKRITVTAKEGFYLVYLFSENLETVYLSLNQGWSFYEANFKRKEGMKKISTVARYWQKILFNRGDNLVTQIKLLSEKNERVSHTNLPRGYEAGNIVGIKYDRNNLPSNQVLVNDLKNMQRMLVDLRRILFSPNNLDASVEHILEYSKQYIDKQNSLCKYDKRINDFVTKYKKIHYVDYEKDADVPEGIKNEKGRKVDYTRREAGNIKLGLTGEQLVLDYERRKLIKAGKNKLASCVEQVSQTRGDGLGYDIVSYTVAGKQVFIEVKTTTMGINTPFYLSENEIAVSEKNSDKYILMRVFVENDDCRFYQISGNMTEKLNLKPQTFLATPCEK